MPTVVAVVVVVVVAVVDRPTIYCQPCDARSDYVRDDLYNPYGQDSGPGL